MKLDWESKMTMGKLYQNSHETDLNINKELTKNGYLKEYFRSAGSYSISCVPVLKTPNISLHNKN